MHTTIRKNTRGLWEARSEMRLDPKDNRVLQVVTGKDHTGRLRTFASVARKEGSFLHHHIFQDYAEIVFSVGAKRVTESVVRAQHESIDLESLVERAKAHYA